MLFYFRCHLPTLYIGMECMRTHSYKLAEQVYFIKLDRFKEGKPLLLFCGEGWGVAGGQ